MKPDEQTRLLEEWFQFAVEDPLVIDSECINTEAVGNMCTFSQADRSAPKREALVAWIQRVATGRATQLGDHAMTFYCWHDAQARQLRVSLVSTSHGRLPFGCAHIETRDIGAVADAAISDWCNLSYRSCQVAEVEGPAEDAPFYTQARPLWVGVIRLGLTAVPGIHQARHRPLLACASPCPGSAA